MTTIQIPSINYENGKIQNCELIINSQKFNVQYQNNQYNITQGDLVTNQNNDSNKNNQSVKFLLKETTKIIIHNYQPMNQQKKNQHKQK